MIGFWIAGAIILLFGFVVFRGAPYVPSKPGDLERAFRELYALNERDFLVDIGSGDGVVLRAASKKGAHAFGYELNPLLVWISRLLSHGDANVKVVLADFWRQSLPEQTTVVYTFGDGRDIAKMATKVQNEATRQQKELYFISYGFAVPGLASEKEIGAHKLYHFKPLQPEKA